MERLTALATSSQLMTWVIPIAIVVLTTALGWIAERLTIRWVKRFAGHGDPVRELAITRTLRGHITFWGFLVGLSLGLAPFYTDTFKKTVAAQWPPTLVSWYSTVGLWYPKALTALFILSLTFMLARLTVAMIRVSTTGAARPVVSLISNVAWFVTLVIGFMLVLSTLQINITPWLTALGVAGLAVSLALQATLTDLISGMLLLGTRQIEVGNYVKLSSGEEGYIADINWRTTTIRQLGANQIIVPNSKMTQSSVTNYHSPQPNLSVSVSAGVSYSSDLDHVERVTIEVGQEVMREVEGGVPDFTPVVRFNELGDYSVRFSVSLQAAEFADQYRIKSEFIKRLRARYRQEGISIPIPSQAVRLSEAATDVTPDSQPPGAPSRPRGPAKAGDGAKRRA
jgi:small-conductance mechanosensitive channel